MPTFIKLPSLIFFLTNLLWQQQQRVPYKLLICTECNWHCVQDKEHVLSDCPSAELRIKHHHHFRTLFSGSSRLRDFASQADKGLALFVHECMECCAYISEHHLASLLMVLVAGLFGFS